MQLRLVVVVPIVMAVATSALAQTQRRKTQKSRSSPSAPATGLARHLPPPDWDRCVEKIRPSVVRVSWKKDEQQGRAKKETEMIGSGFAVGDGTLIVTNSHVVQGQKEVSVESPMLARTKAAVVVDVPHRDLAVFRIAERLPPLVLAQHHRDADVSQYWMGCPIMVMGYGRNIENLQNRGVIVATEYPFGEVRQLFRGESILGNDTTIIVTNCTFQHGHSGSPVVTPDGLVAGVAQSILVGRSDVNFMVSQIHVAEALRSIDADMPIAKGKISTVERRRIKSAATYFAVARLREIQRNRPPAEAVPLLANQVTAYYRSALLNPLGFK